MKNLDVAKSRYGRWFQLFCCVLAVGGLTGCAFSRTPVKASFFPEVKQPLNAAYQGSLEVGEVKDSRMVTDAMVLLQKANAYGATSGAYVTETAVADIFREGLKKAMEQNGFTGTNAVHYVLHSDLRGFGIGGIQNGPFSAVTVKPRMEVRFELENKETGRPVWHDIFTGQATDQLSVWTGVGADDIAKYFSAAATDVVKQLMADKAFRGFFEK